MAVRVRLTRHAVERIKERGLGNPDRVRKRVARVLPVMLKKGVTPNNRLGIKVPLKRGAYAICTPERTGWNIVTVIVSTK